MVDWDLYGWVKRSDQRQELVQLLETPRTPKELADKVDTHIAHISNSLTQFQEKELVKCLNDDAHTGRLYVLTDTGKEILHTLEK